MTMGDNNKTNIRMDSSSWSQICRDLEKFYAMDVEETEVWQSVEVQRDDGTWYSPAREWNDGS
jgi:hypothetical protein